MSKVIVFGTTEISMLNHFYLSHDTDHEVVGFTVDDAYFTDEQFCGLPVVRFSEVERVFPPLEHKISILLGFRNLNRLRAEKFAQAKAKGYEATNYVSSKAQVWPGSGIGDNSHVYEHSVVQPFGKIGNNVVISPGGFIGHHSEIEDHCFLSARATIMGDCRVGARSVVGAGATIVDGVTIGEGCIIGAGAVMTTDAAPGSVYVPKPPEKLPKSSHEIEFLLTLHRDWLRDQNRS